MEKLNEILKNFAVNGCLWCSADRLVHVRASYGIGPLYSFHLRYQHPWSGLCPRFDCGAKWRRVVGYGDGVAPDGSDGKRSTIVEYKSNGDVVTTYTVLGHNDGLRVNPKTKQLWALQNEDASPNLVIINPKTQTQTMYTFGPTAHGGGYDDMAFRGNDVFISASNPANNPNAAPAIVKAQISGGTVVVTPALSGTATASDIPTDTPTSLNLQDQTR